MTQLVDMRVAELMASRLCHDLVSPVGAASNGAELIGEIEDAMRDEVIALIGQSARQAAARLQFYRMAFGLAGTDGLDSIEAVRELAEGLLQGGRVSLECPRELRSETLSPGRGKMLMNMIALAAECLPRAGVLAVEGRHPAPLAVSAQGDGARIEEASRRALAQGTPVEHLTARSVQAYFTMRLAERLGGRLEVAEVPNMVRFALIADEQAVA